MEHKASSGRVDTLSGNDIFQTNETVTDSDLTCKTRSRADIDAGPYLRQEGRLPPRSGPGARVTEQAVWISARLRMPDLPAGRRLGAARRVEQSRQGSAQEITVWLNWLVQRIRRPV